MFPCFSTVIRQYLSSYSADVSGLAEEQASDFAIFRLTSEELNPKYQSTPDLYADRFKHGYIWYQLSVTVPPPSLVVRRARMPDCSACSCCVSWTWTLDQQSGPDCDLAACPGAAMLRSHFVSIHSGYPINKSNMKIKQVFVESKFSFQFLLYINTI